MPWLGDSKYCRKDEQKGDACDTTKKAKKKSRKNASRNRRTQKHRSHSRSSHTCGLQDTPACLKVIFRLEKFSTRIGGREVAFRNVTTYRSDIVKQSASITDKSSSYQQAQNTKREGVKWRQRGQTQAQKDRQTESFINTPRCGS